MKDLNKQNTNNSKALLVFKLYIGTSLLVFLLMMLAGGIMRAAQAEFIEVSPTFFYELMTVHGAGMVGIAGLVTAAINWYFLRKYVALNNKIFFANYVLFLIGVCFILGSIFIGKFASAWTFLYPLPAKSQGIWGPNSAASFLLGLLIIGVGFLLFYLDIARAILQKYGNLSKALGLHYLFGKQALDEEHPPTIVASTMVLIVNMLGILMGAIILSMSIINLYAPSVEIDPLYAKHLTYFFGHVFINATIYMAVIFIYEILPQYTNRPWKVNKWFLGAWFSSTIMVMAVYPHHLLMDFAVPKWISVIGQVLSYMNGFPVLLVTAYGALTLIYRSGIKWDLPSRLMLLAMFGWSAGVIPAIIDATISVNTVMHNTMWVPGHFHFYLLLGLLPMIFGFILYVTRYYTRARTNYLDELGFSSYVTGSLILVVMFLLGGAASVPRRWAEHLPEWVVFDQAGTVGAVLVILGTIFFIYRCFSRFKYANL